LLAIDPVLSRARATLSLELPQATVENVETGRFANGEPMTPRKSVFMETVPFTVTDESSAL
jgi:hypothetical protein